MGSLLSELEAHQASKQPLRPCVIRQCKQLLSDKDFKDLTGALDNLSYTTRDLEKVLNTYMVKNKVDLKLSARQIGEHRRGNCNCAKSR